jgi:hypothetical protein
VPGISELGWSAIETEAKGVSIRILLRENFGSGKDN